MSLTITFVIISCTSVAFISDKRLEKRFRIRIYQGIKRIELAKTDVFLLFLYIIYITCVLCVIIIKTINKAVF